MGIRKLFALLLVPAYVVLIAVLDTLQIQAVFEPPLLLPVMNILFLGIVPVAVAYVAGRVYLTTGTSSILLTGCGMLAFALCSMAAGSLMGMSGGPNMTVTMHNTGALVGAFLLALGSILNLVGRTSPDQRGTGKQTVATAYGCVCILVVIYTFATVKGLVPSFFIQGVGPTLLRQTVLATAIILFVLSSAFAGYTYGQWKSDFLYWYSLGLALIAIGLCAVFLQMAVGSPIGWLGRSAQYIGGVLLLVAILTAARSARDKSLPIERVIANFLADAEASYRNLVEAARDAIVSFDHAGRIISWNSAAEAMFGHTTGDAIGSSFVEFLASEGHFTILTEEIRRVRAKPKKSLSVRAIEVEGKRTDGSLFPMEVSVSARDLPTGRVTSCIIRDVTERTRAAQELRTREAMMRAILASSPIGIVLTQDRRIKWANDSWVRMFGFATEDEYLDQPTSIIHPSQEGYDRIRKILYDHVGGGQVSESHAILKRKDGTLFDGSIRINLVDASDPSKGTISAMSDITEKKRAEEALAQAEERYRSMFHNMPAGVAVYETADAGKTFLFKDFNVTAEAVSKVKREEVIGKSLLECFPKMEEFGLVDALRQAWDTGLPQWIPPRYYKDERREGWRENHVYKLPSGELVAIYEDVTELMLAHAQLKESEEKYRNIFDNAVEGIFQSNPKGQLITVNSAYARMFGYGSPEEMVSEVTDIARQLYADPADRANVMRLFENSFALENYEIQCRRKDGSYFWVSMNARSVRDESGRILYYEGMTEDITARKQAEEALRKSEALLREAQRAAHIGHWEIDSPNGTPTWSEEIFHIFGLDPARGEPSFPAHQNLIHPDDWDLLNYSVIRGTDQGVTFDIDFRLKRPDGSVRWMNARGYPTGKRQGQFFRIFGTAQDITERKLAQEALRESEQRYRVLFNDSKDGVYVTSRDGQLLDANQAYFDLFGYERAEIVGGDIRATYVNPSDRDRFVQSIESSGFLKDYPLSFRKKDGKEMDCLLTASLRREEDGTILGYHGIIRDVTEQKNLQKQLLQAQKMEAIGTLAGGIAHDFNNLLTVMQGFSELLLAEKDQKHPEYEDLRKIFHAARNGADLVQRLLMFSRKSEPKPAPMNLNKQILQVEKLLRRTVPRMIEFDLILSPDLPAINADPSQVEQVLMNLAVNARDAMPDVGKLTVRTSVVTLDEEYCGLHLEATPGEYVLLEVSDTGHGMDKETLEHIFEPFFTTKEMGRGTGLGLAMVYGIVKQHNGHITVYSEVGTGTTFRVYLPTIPSDAEPEIEESGIMPAFGTETVLLVDDEEFVRDLGARILTKHGYTLLLAENGREALNVFKSKRSQISLIILDLIMPEMGGTECLKELLKIDPQVNVLVASGFSVDASVKETIQVGAKGFVTKPFRVKELLRDVRRVLDEG